MAKLTFARIGRLTLDWTTPDNMRIVREDNLQTIELSLSEWIVLSKCVELHSWPVAPPGVGNASTVET